MHEFTIGQRTYRTCRMNAFKQLHVARRILPVFAKLPEMVGMSLEEIMKDTKGVVKNLMENLDVIKLDVIAGTLSMLKDEDINYVLNACCESVEIKEAQGIGWARVMRDGALMYQHVGPQEMIAFLVHVIKDNLSGFFSGNALTSGQGEAIREPIPTTL